jgi:hypothetical protein
MKCGALLGSKPENLALRDFDERDSNHLDQSCIRLALLLGIVTNS